MEEKNFRTPDADALFDSPPGKDAARARGARRPAGDFSGAAARLIGRGGFPPARSGVFLPHLHGFTVFLPLLSFSIMSQISRRADRSAERE
jgi:hypothetical protein